jgi:DNA polymerase III delta prime subunit
MTQPEKLLQQVFNSHQGRAWFAQLTAGFFDDEVHQRTREAIESALPGIVPQLDPEARDILAAGVFQELCLQASREIRRPAANAPCPAVDKLTPLIGAALEDAILNRYPYPIAAAYDALNRQRYAAAGFGCLLDTFEALVHYLATVAVSAYLRTHLDSSDCNQFLVKMLMKKDWATGDLFRLMNDVAKSAGDCCGQMPYPLATHLRNQERSIDAYQILNSFTNLRNRKWGHSTGRSEATFAEILAPNRQRLEAELARMHWLADWALIRPVVIEKYEVRSAHLLNGCQWKRPRDFTLRLEPGDLPANGGDVWPDRDTLLLVAPGRDRYLPLFPLSVFKFLVGPSSHGAYFLQKLRWQEKWRLGEARFVAYGIDAPHEERPGDPVVRCLEKQANRLLTSLAPEAHHKLKSASQPVGDPDYSLAEVLAEQQSHLKVFVGRDELLRRIAEWIDHTQAGGYLLLVGPPGQGKSALMAELARREGERGGCLLHMVKCNSEPLCFVRALICQAAKLAGVTFGSEAYRGDLDALRKSLAFALATLCQKTGRAIMVIDALDELEPGSDYLRFLPLLPEGARVVLTARHDTLLIDALKKELHGRLTQWDVVPLSLPEFNLLLERKLGASVVGALAKTVDFEALFDRMAGNALFLTEFVDGLGRRWKESSQAGQPLCVDPEDLPASLDEVLRVIHDYICPRKDQREPAKNDREPTPGERQRAGLLYLLCVAREALPIEALSELVAEAREPLVLEECRDRLAEISQWLLEDRAGRFRPWHQEFVNYVRKRVLGPSRITQLEDLFCHWLMKHGSGNYGLRHRVSHLLAAGRKTEAFRLFMDLRELKARVEAGLLFELLADIAAVRQARPEGEDRNLLARLEEHLRLDTHFIERHHQDYPRALFQGAK